MNLKIRDLSKNDIEKAMELVLAEGWNQTTQDWLFMIENSKNHCYAIDVDGKLVATGVVMIYSGKIAWIGMVLVNQNFRGWGIGRKLFERLILEANSMEAIKLDATPAGKKMYEKFGFHEEFQILRMVRIPGRFEAQVDISRDFKEILKNDLSLISECDEHAFGVKRDDLIQYLLDDKAVKGWKCAVENETNDFLLGRKGNRFVQIGPVVAVSSKNAIALISRSMNELVDETIVLDVLEDKKELISWLNSVGFEKQRSFTRMYSGKKIPDGNTDVQYLICGPEFG